MGIAEEHATTLAAGMASAGLKPYLQYIQHSYKELLIKIIHDVCIQNMPVFLQ